MASFNKVILLGNLTRDPETRTTASGFTIAKLGLAMSYAYTTKGGEKREEVTFVDVDAFGKQAEIIAKYLRKGSPIHIEGRLKLDQWETNEGQKRLKLGVVLESFQFIGSKSNGGSSSVSTAPSSSPINPADPDKEVLDEEPPF